MFLSKLFFSSKKNLRLKCSQCRRLLSSSHFGSLSAPSHTLTCLTCKPLCVVCGIRKPLALFSEGATYNDTHEKEVCGGPHGTANSSTLSALISARNLYESHRSKKEHHHLRSSSSASPCSPGLCVCNGCLAKSDVAKTNVYFRYPVLKYRSCPFSTEEYRRKLLSNDLNK